MADHIPGVHHSLLQFTFKLMIDTSLIMKWIGIHQVYRHLTFTCNAK